MKFSVEIDTFKGRQGVDHVSFVDHITVLILKYSIR